MIDQHTYEESISQLKEKLRLEIIDLCMAHDEKRRVIENKIQDCKKRRNNAAKEKEWDDVKFWEKVMRSYKDDRSQLAKNRDEQIRLKKERFAVNKVKLDMELDEWRRERKERGTVSRREFGNALRTIHKFLAQDKRTSITVNYGEKLKAEVRFYESEEGGEPCNQ